MPKGVIRQEFRGDPGPLLKAIKAVETAVNRMDKKFGKMADQSAKLQQAMAKSADTQAKAAKMAAAEQKKHTKAIVDSMEAHRKAAEAAAKHGNETERNGKKVKGFARAVQLAAAKIGAFSVVGAGLGAVRSIFQGMREEAERLGDHVEKTAKQLGKLNQLDKSLEGSKADMAFLGAMGAGTEAEVGAAAFQLQSSAFANDRNALQEVGLAGRFGIVDDLQKAIQASSMVKRAAGESGKDMGFGDTASVLIGTAKALDTDVLTFSEGVAKASASLANVGIKDMADISGMTATVTKGLGLTPESAAEQLRALGTAAQIKGISGNTAEELLANIGQAFEQSGEQNIYKFLGEKTATRAYQALTKDDGGLEKYLGEARKSEGLFDRRIQRASKDPMLASVGRKAAMEYQNALLGQEEGIRETDRDAYTAGVNALQKTMGRAGWQRGYIQARGDALNWWEDATDSGQETRKQDLHLYKEVIRGMEDGQDKKMAFKQLEELENINKSINESYKREEKARDRGTMFNFPVSVSLPENEEL